MEEKKRKTRDTTQYKIVIIYIFKKKKKMTIWKFSPWEAGKEKNRTGSYAGGKSGTKN